MGFDWRQEPHDHGPLVRDHERLVSDELLCGYPRTRVGPEIRYIVLRRKAGRHDLDDQGCAVGDDSVCFQDA